MVVVGKYLKRIGVVQIVTKTVVEHQHQIFVEFGEGLVLFSVQLHFNNTEIYGVTDDA